MGLGGDTIDVLTKGGPYRGMDVNTQVSIAERIGFLAGHGVRGLGAERLYPIALSVPNGLVFEAVAAGRISPEQGAYILMLRRSAERAALPWFARLALWLVEMWRDV